MNPAPDHRTDQPAEPVAEPVVNPPGRSTGGHPVRSFIALAAVAVAVLLAMAWTGVSNPRLWSPGGGGWSAGPTPYLLVNVRNDGAVPVRIEAAAPHPGLGGAGLPVLVGPSHDRPEAIKPTPFAPFTLGAGQTWSFYVAGTKHCEVGQTSTLVTFAELDLEVRAPAGWRQHRTFNSGSGSQDQTFSCP